MQFYTILLSYVYKDAIRFDVYLQKGMKSKQKCAFDIAITAKLLKDGWLSCKKLGG